MMDRRNALILAGVTAIAVAGGITVAVVQPNRQEISAPDVSQATPMTPATPTANGTPQTQSPITSENQSNSPTNSTDKNSSDAAKVPPSRDVQSCVVSMAVVEDSNPPLNVRSAPTTEGDNIVGKLDNGTFLNVSKEQQGWFQITVPLEGWVAKSRTRSGCNQKVERVNFGTGNTATEIGDRFIGTGSHQYLFRAQAGQTLTLTRQSGPFPHIAGPNGRTLFEGPDDNRDRWSGTLPVTGDYAVSYDSNYKGYAYSFIVEID